MKNLAIYVVTTTFLLAGCASLNDNKQVAETVKNAATGSGSPEQAITDAANQVTGELSTQNFVQSSAIRADSRTTINLGLGRRYLSDDESMIFGLNAFFDIDPEYDHQRASIGAEVKSSAVELTINNYYGLTGFKDGKNGNSERALGGYDIEVGAQIPYIPAAKIYVQQFVWESHDGVADIEGNTYSLEFAQVFNSGISLEAGRRNFDGLTEDEDFVKLTYNLPYGDAPQNNASSLFSKNMFEKRSMKKDMLKKVRRHNQIVVQTKFSTAVGAN
jgi:hypothetical protein